MARLLYGIKVYHPDFFVWLRCWFRIRDGNNLLEMRLATPRPSYWFVVDKCFPRIFVQVSTDRNFPIWGNSSELEGKINWQHKTDCVFHGLRRVWQTRFASCAGLSNWFLFVATSIRNRTRQKKPLTQGLWKNWRSKWLFFWVTW